MLFVGDIANEAVGLVRQIAALDLPKAVIFRQPRCLVTQPPTGARKQCPYNRAQKTRVLHQLATLGQPHGGYW